MNTFIRFLLNQQVELCEESLVKVNNFFQACVCSVIILLAFEIFLNMCESVLQDIRCAQICTNNGYSARNGNHVKVPWKILNVSVIE